MCEYVPVGFVVKLNKYIYTEQKLIAKWTTGTFEAIHQSVQI